VLEGKAAFPMRVMAAFEAMLGKQIDFGGKDEFPFRLVVKINSRFRGTPLSPTSTMTMKAPIISLGWRNATQRRCVRTSASIS